MCYTREPRVEWRGLGVSDAVTHSHIWLQLTSRLAARRLLKSMSVKQGIKYDSPESKLEIPTFIAFHNLNVDEILDPINSFRKS